MDLITISSLIKQFKQAFMTMNNIITWQQFVIVAGTVSVFLFSTRLMSGKHSSRKTRSVRHEPKFQMQQKVRVDELYKRIHNITEESARIEAEESTLDIHIKPRLNIQADSGYHHAIKLLRNGMDVQKLVEYCNLTMGEAELLIAMYSEPTTT